MKKYRKTSKDDGQKASLMNEAVRAFEAAGIRVAWASEYQLKYYGLNYYPNSGAIYRDGAVSREEAAGIDAFIRLAKSH